MKIEQSRGLTPINPYKKQLGQRPDAQAAEKENKRDVVDISKEALKLQGENRIEKERTEKVDSLKSQIESGQYQVDHKAVAEKMVAYFRQIGGIE
jgi:negative regulator of flagellin synthesis FlgM